MDPNQNLRCVVCIDFGTARTGAAYTITTINTLSQNWANQEAIRLILDPRDQSYNKVPTIVLFETNEYRLLKQPAVKFGKNAFNYYDRLQSSKWKHYELFQYFKLSLDNIKTNNPSIFSLKGNEYKIIDVLAGLFMFIKNQLVFSMTNSGYGSLLNHCKWVLTIPLIWDKRIIQIMRTAAFEGGLIKSLDSKNIIFEYEPEAVGLFFRETANKTFTKKPFLVIDAGGGTIDISLIKQKFDKNNQPKGFKIMMTPKSGKYGSMFINDEFIKYFEEWINFDDKKDFLDLQNNSYFAKLINTFNMQKESISHNQCTSEDEILLEISQKLIKAILGRSKKTFQDLTKEFNEKLRKSNRDQMKWDEDEDTFIITGKQMKMFFKKALAPFVFNLRKIINLQLFQDEVDLVVCSGGLSNSIIFQNLIRKELQNTSIQVSFSENASCAVILGGIRLGLNPKIILSRRSPFTYGIVITEKFNSKKHKQNKKIINQINQFNSEMLCKDVIMPLCFFGQKIKNSDKFEANLIPLYDDQLWNTFQLVRSRSQKWEYQGETKYLDDDEIELFAKIHF